MPEAEATRRIVQLHRTSNERSSSFGHSSSLYPYLVPASRRMPSKYCSLFSKRVLSWLNEPWYVYNRFLANRDEWTSRSPAALEFTLTRIIFRHVMRQLHGAFIAIECVNDGLFILIQQTFGVTTSTESHVQEHLESIVNSRSRILAV